LGETDGKAQLVYRIEPMTEADLPRAFAIEEASFPSTDVQGGGAAQQAKQLREELSRSWSRLRVARTATHDVVGYVLFWHVTDEIHLLNVAVDPAERRHGFGRALAREVIAYAERHNCVKILLEVRKGNVPAIRLYESLGFEEFNVRTRYYADGEDGIEMMLTF